MEESIMNDFFDHSIEVDAVMTGFHEELYQLEEEYLKLFGIYPTMPDLSKDTVDYYVEKIRRCLLEGKMIEDLEIGNA